MTSLRKSAEPESTSPAINPGDEAALADARMQDAALILPVAGAILLMPPVIELFTVAVNVLGAPLIVSYVFGVWAALILAAWLLARRLTHPGFAHGGGEGEG